MRVRLLAALVSTFGLAVFAGYACGGGEDGGCPGKVCFDCASQDCAVGPCPEGELEFCGHFGYWPDDETKRCAFCESPDFEP